MDSIAFERRTLRGRGLADDKDFVYEVMSPVINGERLEDLWNRSVADRRAAPLGSLAFYGTEPSPKWVIDDGRVAILTCTCGEFGCGGAVARIGFLTDRVTWRDFASYSAESPEPVAIGPFEFDRSQYESALANPVEGHDESV